VLPLDAFLTDLAASGFAGSVSLEVDLRTYLTDPIRLRQVMTSMREDAERRLTVGASNG
jgi:hypothetical protein